MCWTAVFHIMLLLIPLTLNVICFYPVGNIIKSYGKMTYSDFINILNDFIMTNRSIITSTTKIATFLCGFFFYSSCSGVDDTNMEFQQSQRQSKAVYVSNDVLVSPKEATATANLFLNRLIDDHISTRSHQKSSKGSMTIQTITEKGEPLMYIINYSNGGFVIVGATKNYYPILAYSEKEHFGLELDNYGVAEWFNDCKEAIKTSSSQKETVKKEMLTLWKNYEMSDSVSFRKSPRNAVRGNPSDGETACWNRCDELQTLYGADGWNFSPLSSVKPILDNAGFSSLYDDLCYSANFNHSSENSSVVGWKHVNEKEIVGPLLSTKWYQEAPFNKWCDGKPAGCGAIALSQVMMYYKYPKNFTFAGHRYDWERIPVEPDESSYQAALVKFTGDIIGTHYSSKGSWTTPGNMENGIRKLGYKVSKYNHYYETVASTISNYRRPIIMVGNDDNLSFLPGNLKYIGGSHYWVCDGVNKQTTNRLLLFMECQPYDNGKFIPGWNTKENPDVLGGIIRFYFHINWGWGGNHDGWFSSTTDSGNGNFKHSRKDFYITKP